MLNIKKEEQVPEREPLTGVEKAIIADEYYTADSAKVEEEINCKIDSLQHFILFLIKKYPALANRLNGNIVKPIINPIEQEYEEAVVETDEVYKSADIKPQDEKELVEKLVTDKSKKYFPSVIERHRGFEEYVKKFATQEPIEEIGK